MGLTVAEAFMLVAFMLMMMFLFWRFEVEEEKKPVPEESVSPEVWRLLPHIEALPPETRRKLGDLLRRPSAGEEIALAEGLSEADRKALQRGAKPVESERLEELEDALAFAEGLSEADRKALQRGAKPVEPERLEELEDALAFAEGLSEADRKALQRGAKPVEPERLEELEDALALRDHLDPYGEDSNEAIKQRIDQLLSQRGRLAERLAEEDRAREELVDELERDLGDEIRAAGGRIDEFDGTITFPDNALFPVGQDDILPRFVETLNRMCPIWLETLRKSDARRKIEEILIEGHSSSEWHDAETNREAWVLNLELSQRRAQAVLAHCLNLVEGTPFEDWSRAKLAAIGYSSSRPVLEDGREDPRRSRRAVFGMRLSREQLREEIQRELRKEGRTATRGPANAGTLSGRARVKDADTIEIQGFGIRLHGIDALERKQSCVRANGERWACGLEAKKAVEDLIGEQEVVCGDLRLGLLRYRGRCRIDGEDLGRWVVRQGWAFAKYADDYIPDEADARAARRGAWSGARPEPPWEWRKGNRGHAPGRPR